MITAGVLLFIVAVGDNGLALAVIRSDETLRPTPQTPGLAPFTCWRP
jgi:hypothetical protein